MEETLTELLGLYHNRVSVANLLDILSDMGFSDTMEAADVESVLFIVDPSFKGAFTTPASLQRAIYALSGAGKNIYHAMFRYADRNYAGTLDKYSLITLISNLGIGLTEAAAEEFMRLYAGGRPDITFEEFHSILAECVKMRRRYLDG